MEKELLRQAFNAGIEHRQQYECPLAESYDKPDFDEWYDKLVLSQSNVSRQVCDHRARCLKCHELVYQKSI